VTYFKKRNIFNVCRLTNKAVYSRITTEAR